MLLKLIRVVGIAAADYRFIKCFAIRHLLLLRKLSACLCLDANHA
jgi:hypothetical protein